jgi:hypothetical protein
LGTYRGILSPIATPRSGSAAGARLRPGVGEKIGRFRLEVRIPEAGRAQAALACREPPDHLPVVALAGQLRLRHKLDTSGARDFKGCPLRRLGEHGIDRSDKAGRVLAQSCCGTFHERHRQERLRDKDVFQPARIRRTGFQATKTTVS